MSRIKTLCLMAFAVAAFGAATAGTASAAITLPGVLWLAGETNSVELKGSSTTAATKLWGVTGLAGVGWLAELFAEGADAKEGLADILFTSVELSGTGKCKSSGDVAGEVLFPTAKWQLVTVSKAPLTVAVLITVSETVIECGTGTPTKIKVKGNQAITISKFGSGGLGTEVGTTESFGGKAECTGASKTTQVPAAFLNDEEKEVKTKLEANVGLGFEKACEEVTGELSLSPTRMIAIMDE